jgi:Protein of unknown function (DUF3429)
MARSVSKFQQLLKTRDGNPVPRAVTFRRAVTIRVRPKEPCVHATPISPPPPAGPSPARPSPAGPPLLAWRLGYLALLPFVLGAAMVWFVRPDARGYATSAMSAYAAVIVAFLGGVHWGFGFRAAAPDARLFAWGVVPSLVACVALMMQASAALVIHGVMLVVCYGVDRKIYPAQGAAVWLVLRFRLTAVAALSCFLGAAGA